MLAAACMTVCAVFAQKTICVSTEKTDLVLRVSPKGRLYQVYLDDRLLDASDYDQLMLMCQALLTLMSKL